MATEEASAFTAWPSRSHRRLQRQLKRPDTPMANKRLSGALAPDRTMRTEGFAGTRGKSLDCAKRLCELSRCHRHRSARATPDGPQRLNAWRWRSRPGSASAYTDAQAEPSSPLPSDQAARLFEWRYARARMRCPPSIDAATIHETSRHRNQGHAHPANPIWHHSGTKMLF